MGFICIEYYLFLCVALILYFNVSHRFRKIFLLACSYFFYSFYGLSNLTILLLSTSFTFYISHLIHRSKTKGSRRGLFILALVIDIGALVAFKYSDIIFSFIYSDAGNGLDRITAFLLPVGISFYTFQSMSYTIDVYRKTRAPEQSLAYYALYVSFFPQLVSGPIARSSYMLEQFYKKSDFNFENFKSGAALILWGLFKKMVVADRIGILLMLYNKNTPEYSMISNLIVALMFVFEVFLDFSGYCDIAIGSARLFNIELVVNFNKPFYASSLRELWNRWHISLYNWFRDYVYIPLGGNQLSTLKWCGAVMLIYLLMGIWHGSGWNFLMFGLIHGALVISEALIFRAFKLQAKKNTLSILRTVTLFALGSVVFMFNSADDYLNYWKGFTKFTLKNPYWQETLYTLCFLSLFLILEKIQETPDRSPFPYIKYSTVRVLLAYAILFCIIMSANKANINFFYHRF